MAKTPLAASGHHIHHWSMYVKAAVALSVLMGLTIAASFWHAPGGVVVNNLIALAIAVLKTFIVVAWFMNVKFSTSLTKLFAVLGFLWATLIWVILVDYFFRGYEPVPSWSGVQESALPRKIGSTDNAPLRPDEQNVQNRIPRMLGN